MSRESVWSHARGLWARAGDREARACPNATFDGGADDPRTLVYEYQQRLRAAVLARHPNAPKPSRWTGSSGEARRLYAVTTYPGAHETISDVSG